MKNILFAALLSMASFHAVASWEYDTEEDAMTGKAIVKATAQSTSYIKMEFPFRALRPGYLTVENHPRNGKRIVFMAEDGALFCLGPCEVLVRFDDNQPKKYSFKIGEINNEEMIISKDYDDFVSNLVSAKQLKMAVVFYRGGEQIVEFDVSDFKTID